MEGKMLKPITEFVYNSPKLLKLDIPSNFQMQWRIFG
jgi:hypothetical protein